jgi:formylglycine-generating enzyme required for sulfatase activity
MKFVPVPITGGLTDGRRVLFCVWETRVQDYAVFAAETKREWPQPGFPQGPTHPAVNVSWDDAQAFCTWLTERERKSGHLGATERYRLPTDHEWSCAVGLGEREDPTRSPEEKSQELVEVFPWGRDWPPPPGAGNYSGEEAAGHETWKDQSILTGYRDNFPHTAPVGSFAANRFGLFDLGGNAWEWCEDFFKPAQKSRVMRGASFNNGGRGGLFSAKRDSHPPEERKDSYGFRVVVGAEAKESSAR